MFVKLRDKGTIFHDGSQDVSVTGQVPVEVKSTVKVKQAIKNGILVEVEASKAKQEIAKAKDADKAKKDAGKTKDAHKAALKEKDDIIGEKDSEIEELKAKLEEAGGDGVSKEEHDEVLAQLEEVTAKRNELVDEVAELKKKK